MSDGSGTRVNMSEPMTSGTIEDVLTSIRRLVSEDLRPAPQRNPGEAAPAAQIVSRIVVSDKLILTPALRVVSNRPAKPAQTPPGAESAAKAAPQGVAEQPTSPPPSTSLPRLHLEAAHSVPPAPRPAAQPSAPELVATLSQAVDQRAALDWESEAGEPGADTEALNWDNFVFVRRSMQDLWAARESAKAEAPALTESMPTASAPTAPAEPAPVAQAAAEPASQPAARGLDRLVSAVTADWADAAEAEVLADLRGQGLTDAAAPESAPAAAAATAEVLPGVAQQEDDIFSEQVLRELVRDLIREELQGGLGERITRNIRKMVRAEIARSLALQDLS